MNIQRFLPINEYNAAIGANTPSASNVFATIADLTGGDGIYSGSGTVPSTTVATLTDSIKFGSAFISNSKVIIGSTSTPSSATLVVKGVTNSSTTNFAIYSGTLSGRIDFGVSANNPNISMYNSAGVQQVNFDSGSSSSWTLRPFGVNMVGGTARLSVKALSNGTDQAFRIRNNTDTLDLMKVQGNGRVAIGNITTPTSILTVDGDVETLNNTDGLIVLDRTDGNRYRIYTDGGVLQTELVP